MNLQPLIDMSDQLHEFLSSVGDRVDMGQVVRGRLDGIEARTEAGLGLDGQQFAPLKNGQPAVVATNQVFSQAVVSSSKDSGSLSFEGDLATIVAKNDDLRPFWGLNDDDRDRAAGDVMGMVVGRT